MTSRSMTGHAPPGPQQGVATSAYSPRCKNARSPISYTFAQAKTRNNKVLRTWYCSVNHKLAMLVRQLDATTRRYVHSNISQNMPWKSASAPHLQIFQPREGVENPWGQRRQLVLLQLARVHRVGGGARARKQYDGGVSTSSATFPAAMKANSSRACGFAEL